MIETKGKQGVTLAEFLLVVLVLVALGALAVPRISRSAQNARQNACDTHISIINAAIETYAAENDGYYPSDTRELNRLILDNPRYFPQGRPSCPLGGAYVLDPERHLALCTHRP